MTFEPRYSASTITMPGTTTARSHLQPIAPAPNAGPALRPVPPEGSTTQLGGQSPYGSGSLMLLDHVLYDGAQPTRVVGSQGRRGILPCTTGRPAVPPTGTKHTSVHIKDADGKYPCPHCTKSYLHAKHLKRHLLRHTGDRPYMCVLCHDTFSRSDILKRHFQKCSIRRGNPTGLSHLSHPQARIKNHAEAQITGVRYNQHGTKCLIGLNNMPCESVGYPFGMSPVSDDKNNKPGDQNGPSHSTSDTHDRNNMAPDMGAPQPYGSMFLSP